ncbi:hypothetical protein [Corynebacterium dentalis]|uniref:hypothetical protein n=1 Tax=Corynebacterium dentalis TaxID=2014528 RepID=UPI00289EF2B8|nr:hypothetical protein [Corynebacterium dentalis]
MISILGLPLRGAAAATGLARLETHQLVLTPFRETFTRAHPRIPLDEFHRLTESFLHQLKFNGQTMRRLDRQELRR